MNSKRKSIFEEIELERHHQDTKFGAEFDDSNRPNDWVAYITAYSGKAFFSNPMHGDWSLFRTMMVKVAALAVAAIEAVDRKFPNSKAA